MNGFFQDHRVDLVRRVRAAEHAGIHNFTIGTLTTYFRLEETASSFDNDILILDGLRGRNQRKVFVYGENAPDKALQTTSVLYSIHRLPFPKESRFAELTYTLSRVFDPTEYTNAKKRNQRLKQPFNRLRSYDITLRALTKADMPEIARLHTEWCVRKLALPDTFKMMFPKKRYLNCASIAIARPREYVALGAFSDQTLLAVHIYFVERCSAFDLACFADEPYSNFSEDFYIASLAHLRDKGIDYVNCGASLHAKLTTFKRHWPSAYVYSWAYGRITK